MPTPAPEKKEFAFDEKAFLEKIPHPVTQTNLKGAYAGVAPPDNFDPNKATTVELVKAGVPWRRPTASDPPEVRAAWDKAFSRKWLAQDRIIPVLEPQVGRQHYLRKKPKQVTEGNFLDGTWAGAATYTGGPYTGIIGYWYVPTVSDASEPKSSAPSYDSSHGIAYDSSSWIGIDGFNPVIVSNDVLQCGIEHYVDTSGKAHYVAWYEWFAPSGPPPAYVDQTNIVNFTVNPGNEIYASVSYNGKTSGSLYMANMTTGQHFSITLAPPSGATFAGNTVEWIVEDPDGGEEFNTALAKFTQVQFTNAMACPASGPVNNPQSDDTCNIETTGGKLLTKTTLGNYTVTIDFVG